MNKYKVEYLIVGGYAVGVHGHFRATNDIDIWINNTMENAEKMVKVATVFGIVEDDVYPEMFITDSRNVFIGEAPLLIDIMNKLARVEFNEAFPNRTIVILDDVPVNCISLDDLKEAKQAAARPKDLEDLKHLQRISEAIKNEKNKEQ